jgi:TRAP-type transport system periplasmic protein
MTYAISRRCFLGGMTAAAGTMVMPHFTNAQKKTVLRYGNSGAATTLGNVFNQKLSDDLSGKTDGALSFEIFAGSMGGEQKLLDSLALGSLDLYNGAYTGTREFDIFYSPYFFKDGAHAKRVADGEIGKKASIQLGTRYSSRLIGVGRLGGFNLMLAKPITSFAELKGLKIRSPQIEGCLEGLRFFGAIPAPIPFNEIYLALQQGIVDGVLTGLNPGVSGKFYEVAQYVIEADFGLALDKQVISESAWNSLSAEHQSVLQTSFDTLEGPEYFTVGLEQKKKDLEIWAGANGADAVIKLDSADLMSVFEPLNEKLADGVYGAGAWEQIKNS